MTETVAGVSVDAFGLTDAGKLRDNNEDHFAIATVSKSVIVSNTSLPTAALAGHFGVAGGHLFAVADGVGGRPEGDVASERAISAMLSYVGRAAECFHGLDANREQLLLDRLEATVQAVHNSLVKEYGGVTAKLPATTLTMVLLIWPRAYLVHVGDSRAYVRRHGRLQRLTRDQTYGEYMVSLGAWTEEQVARASTASALSSAVGGSELEPVVGLVDLEPGDSLMLCTDGLSKHVNDDRIAAALEQSITAEATCRQLVDEALAGGGTDNVTVVVVRTAAA